MHTVCICICWLHFVFAGEQGARKGAESDDSDEGGEDKSGNLDFNQKVCNAFSVTIEAT